MAMHLVEHQPEASSNTTTIQSTGAMAPSPSRLYVSCTIYPHSEGTDEQYYPIGTSPRPSPPGVSLYDNVNDAIDCTLPDPN